MTLYNLAKMDTATTGTGTITLGSAVSGFLSFADAGVSDADVVTYAIHDGANSEIGTGTYTASGTTLTRTVLKSTNSDAAINLSGGAIVLISPAAEDLASPDDIREKLTAARTYYVRTDGSDSNTGLVDNSGGAFLTINKAIDTAAALDSSIYNVTIYVRAGTYTAAVVLKGLLGSGTLTIEGDTTTPSNVLVSTTSANCFSASNVRGVTITGFKTVTTTSGVHVSADALSDISVGIWDYGAAGGTSAHNSSTNGAKISFLSNYTISGGAQQHLQCAFGGRLGNSAIITVTLTGTPAFAGAFAWAQDVSLLVFWFNTFSGSATGPRYYAALNSAIQTGAGGANYFPGNSAGSTATGGQYA